ncbi:MAG: HAMP domain-containing protein [Candidatus Zixiibacteriota bacterium]|nr:MAG: HAMP domain-containing protein [candidate division Zixibacteria bacterium]
MTFSGRIRLYLVAVAVLPALLVMAVIYFYSTEQLKSADELRAHRGIQKYYTYKTLLNQELSAKITELKDSPDLQRALANVKSGRSGRLELDPRRYGLDFMETVDVGGNVLATYHRPGLLGQQLDIERWPDSSDAVQIRETLEYDLEGAHMASAFLAPLSADVALYTGKYLDEQFTQQLALFMDADVSIHIPLDTAVVFGAMDQGLLYGSEGKYQAVLAGSESPGFYLVATFAPGSDKPIFFNLLSITGIVALVAAVLAIAMGMYVTGQAKREIENLVSATARVAEGDFGTPVMAYEEGEFSQLADSFSDMMLKLRQTQKQLATTEKIAAWQTVGRKIAHEIKNPLTPIAISVDDLRRSHGEKAPEFDRVLDETTRTIKSELDRLIKLLDEFVSFARMRAPEISQVKAAQFVDDIRTLYKSEIEAGRVSIDNKSKLTTFRFDPEAIKQVLINLIKNGLEASGDSIVSVTLADKGASLEITVEDTGPGFTDDKLADSFEPYVSTKEGGSGLGLVICHRIVHDHGGTMELYNKSDKGAGVRFNIPQRAEGSNR